MWAGRINGWLRRISPRWLYLMGLLPPLWLIYALYNGGLGIDPVRSLEHQLGLWGLQVLIATLVITPLRRWTGVSFLSWRRALALIGFFYISLHMAVWVFLDLGMLWGQIWRDLLKRPYLSMGMVGFVLMIPLALTSNNYALRRMGAQAWRRLHWLAYPAILAGGIHFMWSVKAWPWEPLLYMGAIVLLLAERALYSIGRRWRR